MTLTTKTFLSVFLLLGFTLYGCTNAGNPTTNLDVTTSLTPTVTVIPTSVVTGTPTSVVTPSPTLNPTTSPSITPVPTTKLTPTFIPWSGITFEKTYGGTKSDYAESVEQTSDDGFILAGSTNSFGSGGADAWLVKTNSSGSLLWKKTYGGNEDDLANSVQQTSDGGYIFVGYSQSFGAGGADFWLVKSDNLGNTVWDKTYGGYGFDYGNSVQETSDGGYVIAGTTSSFGAGDADYWLVKADSSGNQEWNKTYGGKGNDYANSVQQTSDGGYILAGRRNSGIVWLVKTDPFGTQEWNKTYDGIGDATSIQQTTDGGYIFTGMTTSFGAGSYDAWLVKTDSKGGSEWNKTFGGTSYDFTSSVQQTSDDGYILTGQTSGTMGASGEEAWLIKTDSTGNKVWVKNFDEKSIGTSMGRSAHQTSDGGYIIAGQTTNSGAGGQDFWIVKTDSSGNVKQA